MPIIITQYLQGVLLFTLHVLPNILNLAQLNWNICWENDLKWDFESTFHFIHPLCFSFCTLVVFARAMARILNQGVSSPAVLLFFRDNASAPHESSGSFVLFPLNTTPTTGPSAAPDLQHGLCKYSTRSCPHHTDERPNASESISVSHERPKRSLERAYGGSRCGCLEVSFERVDEYGLDSVVAFSKPIGRK